jgi:hypothetical protein
VLLLRLSIRAGSDDLYETLDADDVTLRRTLS